MKNWLSTILLLCSFSASAQTEGNYNYTIGLNSFSLVQLPKILQQKAIDQHVQMWVNGGFIKFNDNQIGIKLSGYSFNDRKYAFVNQNDGAEMARGHLKDYAFRVGFEKNFNYAILQPYIGLDLGYRHNQFEGDMTPDNSLKPSYTAFSQTDGMTIRPAVGFKINMTKHISVYANSSVEFYLAKETITKVGMLGATGDQVNRVSSFQTLTNPVTVGIQVHFSDLF